MTPRLRRALLLLALLLAAPAALAGGAGSEDLSGYARFAAGTLDGLSLDADGILTCGPRWRSKALEAETAWCHARSSHGLWIGLGDKPAVQYVHPDGGERFAVGEGLMVTALAGLPGDAVAAAVFPGGRIVKVTSQGQLTPLAQLPAQYVWALASTATGVLTAACGMPAALYEIDPMGAVKKLTDVDDQHARCLATSPDGATLYVGTAPKGLLLAWDGTALRVLQDLEPQEVVGIVARADGSLIVAANADQDGGNVQKLAQALRRIAEPQETKAGDKPAPQQALQDGSLLHVAADGVVTGLWSEKKVAVLGVAPDGDGAVAGTYPSARVIRVEPGHPHALLADLPEAEASVVIPVDGRLAAVVTSNPAVLHLVEDGEPRGTWTSAPLDAGAPSPWGRLTLWGTSVAGVRARTGPTSEPDGTWGDWHPLAGFDGHAGSVGANARFLQLEVTLQGGRAELRSLSVVRRTPNHAPTVADLAVEKPGQKEGELPVATAEREMAWKADDPDGDRLRTTLAVRREGSPHWTTLVDGKVLDKPRFGWDTEGLPDGLYEVRVTVADDPDNEPGRERTASALRTAVRVDNTPPTVTVSARRHDGGRLRVEGLAADGGGGRVLLVRVSVDGGPWIPLAADDGLLDSGREPFQGVLRVKAQEAYDVVVQVMDADGNLAAAATVVR